MTWRSLGPAFGLGFALGAAPGPVQVLILSETAKRGLAGGLRVMLGANGTLLVVMIALALGFSSFTLADPVLRTLQLAGGAFIVYLGVTELRSLEQPPEETSGRGGVGPTLKGVLSVVLSPGAWVFFATTAAAVVAKATADGGRGAAFGAALAMAVGVSSSDFSFTGLGSGGRRVLGDRGLRTLRLALALGLLGIGAWFVVDGLIG